MTSVGVSTDGEEPWRTRLGRHLARVTLATVVLGIIPLGLGVGTVHSRRWLLGVAVCLGVVLALIVWRDVSPRTRAGSVVGTFLAMGIGGYAGVGFLGGPTLAFATAAIVAGLLLGRRAMIGVLVFTGLAVTAIGAGMVTGLLPPPDPADVSMLSARSWVRSSSVSLLLSVILATIVTWVVERIESALERTSQEARRRETAERARVEAERRAVDLQKMELVGRLAAGLAHDVNNHLTVIGMWNAVLDGAPSGPERREAVRGIASSISQASALTRQLLVVGRRDVRTPRPLSLRSVVDGYRPTLARVLPADVAVTVEHADSDPWVVADEAQLHQVLLNLAMNAGHAMESGGTLAIRTGRRTTTSAAPAARSTIAPGAWSVLEVEDTGAGMAEETLASAVDPFFTTKPSGVGTGLGLATVAAIAAQSDGHLVLESKPGVGTRAELWLPNVATSIAAAVDTHVAPRRPAPGCTILLVEDGADTLRLAQRLLTSAGCKVLEARDGTAALARLDGHDGRIDLLCSDVVMPGAPVRELLARYAEKHPHAPVLLCSAYVGEELARRGIEDGRYAHLVKPYTPEALLDMVAKLVPAKAGDTL